MKKKILFVFIMLCMATQLFAGAFFSVKKGWNLKGFFFSVSTDFFKEFVQTSDNGSQGAINTLWKWDKDSNNWEIWSPNPNVLSLISQYGMKTFDTINPGEGFWANVTDKIFKIVVPTESYFKGYSDVGDFFFKKTGWHLFSTKKPVTSLPLSIFNKKGIKTLWKWDISSSSWSIWSPDKNILNLIKKYGLKNIDKFEVDDGFWVNTQAEKDFVVKMANNIENFSNGIPFIDENGNGLTDNSSEKSLNILPDYQGFYNLDNLTQDVKQLIKNGTIFSMYATKQLCSLKYTEFLQTVYLEGYDNITFNSITTLIATVKNKYNIDNVTLVLEKVKTMLNLPENFDAKALLKNPYTYFTENNDFDFYKKVLQLDQIVQTIFAFSSGNLPENFGTEQMELYKNIYESIAEILYNNGNPVKIEELFQSGNLAALLNKLKISLPSITGLGISEDILTKVLSEAMSFGKNFYDNIDNLTSDNISEICTYMGSFTTFQEFGKKIVSNNMIDNLSASFNQETFAKYMEIIFKQIKAYNENLSFDGAELSFVSLIASALIEQFKSFDNATLNQFSSAAFVFLDENKNGIMDVGEKIVAMLDKSGALNLDNLPAEIKEKLKNGDVLGLIGGFAKNGDYLSNLLKAVYVDNLTQIDFTPISTFVASLMDNNTTLDQAVEIAKKFFKLSDNLSIDKVLSGVDTGVFLQNIKLDNIMTLIMKIMDSNMGNLPEIEKLNIKKNIYEKIMEFIKKNKDIANIDDLLTDENLAQLMNAIKEADGYDTAIKNGENLTKALTTLKTVNDKMAEVTGASATFKDLKDYQLMADTLIDLFVNIINDGKPDELEKYSNIFAKGALKDLKEVISKVSKTKNLLQVKEVLSQSKDKIKKDIDALETLYNFNSGGTNPFMPFM